MDKTQGETKYMKKVQIATILLAGAVFTASAYAEDGAALFSKGTCNSCHQPAVDTTGPALKAVAGAYKGKEGELVAFLKGSHKPKLEAGRFAGMYNSIMKANVLNTTSKWTDGERKAVAKFILGH
jgi:cytochrome c551/c552